MFITRRQQWFKKTKDFASSRLSNVYGDEEYHTPCFIWSLLSLVVIKLFRFYFPWEREFRLHTAARAGPPPTALSYCALAASATSITVKSTSIQTSQAPGVWAQKRCCAMSQCPPPCIYSTTEGEVVLARHQWLLYIPIRGSCPTGRSVIDSSLQSRLNILAAVFRFHVFHHKAMKHIWLYDTIGAPPPPPL